MMEQNNEKKIKKDYEKKIMEQDNKKKIKQDYEKQLDEALDKMMTNLYNSIRKLLKAVEKTR